MPSTCKSSCRGGNVEVMSSVSRRVRVRAKMRVKRESMSRRVKRESESDSESGSEGKWESEAREKGVAVKGVEVRATTTDSDVPAFLETTWSACQTLP